VRCRFRRWRGWIAGNFALETRWLGKTLGVRVGIFIEMVRVTLPTLTIGGGFGVILWW